MTAEEIHCLVCGKSLAVVLHGGGWSDHLHLWDDKQEAARLIAEDEAADKLSDGFDLRL